MKVINFCGDADTTGAIVGQVWQGGVSLCCILIRLVRPCDNVTSITCTYGSRADMLCVLIVVASYMCMRVPDLLVGVVHSVFYIIRDIAKRMRDHYDVPICLRGLRIINQCCIYVDAAVFVVMDRLLGRFTA